MTFYLYDKDRKFKTIMVYWRKNKMKKLGLVLALLAVIIFSGIGFIYYTEGSEAFSTKMVNIHEKQSVNDKGVKAIEINSESVDVKVSPYSESTISIELNGKVSEKLRNAFDLKVSESNGTLSIVVDRTKSPSFTVFTINKRTVLTVQIPEKTYEEISVLSSSADLDIEDLKAESVKLGAKSGDIHAENVNASSFLTLKTTSGDIYSIDNKGQNMQFDAKSGDVNLEMDHPSYQLDFHGTSGEGEVRVPGFQFEEKSENIIKGRVGTDSPLTITVNTKSGDFSLE
jgi:lia operon protein LiaG